jgi:hypothetical protein
VVRGNDGKVKGKEASSYDLTGSFQVMADDALLYFIPLK